MQKYHDEPKQYKGYLKSALETDVGSRPFRRPEVSVPYKCRSDVTVSARRSVGRSPSGETGLISNFSPLLPMASHLLGSSPG